MKNSHFIVTPYTRICLFEFRIYNMMWEDIIYPIGKEITFVLARGFSNKFFNYFGTALKVKKVNL